MDDETRLASSEVEEGLREEDDHLNFLRRNMPIRHILTIMGFLSFTILSMLRVNMSVGIICMVDWNYVPDKAESRATCSYSSNYSQRSNYEDGPLGIYPDRQGHILAGYFYGLLATQYLGVLLAERMSAKYIFLCGTLISSLCTVAVPLVADSNGYYIIITQILKGAGHGLIIPSLNVLLGKWIPRSEIFYSMCLLASGIPFGGFLGTSLAGVICKSDQYGWPYVFYIFAGIGFAYCLIWLVLIFESPLTHPYITYHEMIRILNSQVAVPQAKLIVPYKYILKSLPVWAYIIVGFTSFWALTIYATLIPIFMSTVLKFGIEMAGVWSSLPYVMEMITFYWSCVLIEQLKKIGKVSDTQIHKFQIITGLIGFSVCIYAIPFTGCNRVLTVTFLVLALGFCGQIVSSTSYIPLLLSPRFSSIISAITNTVGAIAGIITPTMMGYITKEKRTMNEWQILFFFTASLGVLALLVFWIFGSVSTQEWDDPAYRGLQRQGSQTQELVDEDDTLPERKSDAAYQRTPSQLNI